jgi:hypothetical protein
LPAVVRVSRSGRPNECQPQAVCRCLNVVQLFTCDVTAAERSYRGASAFYDKGMTRGTVHRGRLSFPSPVTWIPKSTGRLGRSVWIAVQVDGAQGWVTIALVRNAAEVSR